MGIPDRIQSDYFKLFVKREGKVLLGKGLSTLWLLTLVLTATFSAIAFSNGSMKYLAAKMNDPFIRWMDIRVTDIGDEAAAMEALLSEEGNKTFFDYEGYQFDYYEPMFFWPREGDDAQYLRVRFQGDMHTDLVREILSRDNVEGGQAIAAVDIPENTIGVIITKEALQRLGYTKTPPFIDFESHSVGADKYGFHLLEGTFARAPLPVLGVVKRLPSNVDVLSSAYFMGERASITLPFHMGANPQYSQVLSYFVPGNEDRYDKFCSSLTDIASGVTPANIMVDRNSFYKPELRGFMKGDYVTLRGQKDSDVLSAEEIWAVHEAVMKKWGDKGVTRVYDYNFSKPVMTHPDFLSVYFNRLDKIRDFEQFMLRNFELNLDMSQVNAKENFNEVSILAGVLSWAIVIFAIVCIILFIVNLLRSYFQKVKRNLGTFKAFGVSNRSLILVYILIVGGTLLAAIIISLAGVFLLQLLMQAGGLVREGHFGYLSLWSWKTVLSVLIILSASIYTIHAVMGGLLKKTPGDLINDR